MAERSIVAELRAVDAALAPLAPSRELDTRIDALLAGRAPRTASQRVLMGALGTCAAVSAVVLWLGRAGDDAVARAPALSPAPPASTAPPEARPQIAPALAPAAAAPLLQRGALALVDAVAAQGVPAELPASARNAALALPAPPDAPAPIEPSPRRDVSRTGAPRAALVARAGIEPGTDELEEALRALRADKSRGDLKGAVARIDGLLAGGVGARATDILRVERARLQERLGDRAAACAGLQGLHSDDAHDARVRFACP